MTNKMAPIAIFGYNRPEHLRRTLSSLIECEGFGEGPVTVFVDGPRVSNEKQAVADVCSVARELLGSDADIRNSDSNRGLSASITRGVEDRLDSHGQVIVIEDDLKLSPKFLRFMSAALDCYADDPRVFQVSGYMFDARGFENRDVSLFLPLTSTWGWATWSRAWKAYDPLAMGWRRLLSDREMRRRFNLGGSYDFLRLLQNQLNGKSDSWGIRWYWSVFQHGGLCLYPPQSLVHNTGQDGTGTHGGGILGDFSGKANAFTDTDFSMPKNIEVFEGDLKAVREAVWRQNGRWPGWAIAKVYGWLK